MNKRILVIDDEDAIRKSFVLALEDTEYQLDTAESGEKGLELTMNTNYNLVFLDIKMPGLTGVETLRKLRQAGKTMPVYFVTAFHREFLEELAAAQKEGVKFELLQKPIGNEQIIAITNSILGVPEEY